MELEKYPYYANNNFLSYEFYSEGPKGKIKKLVRFTQITVDDPIIYNLAFGDAVGMSDEMDDNAVTDNQDREIVLATVANTLFDFTTHHGNHYVFAQGSSPSRTRLYQMLISAVLNQLSPDFIIFGLRDKKWLEFERNVNYNAFLVHRR